ncbi:MAG: PQQ-binding-like beta-propeller repeat protein, partial [Victivallales bacterium]|nr:PQQ-binding-like beta-propeller repeat protein [Victivallales bacterium]
LTGQKIAYHASANSDRPGAEKGVIWLAPQFAPTMVMYGDVVAFAGGRQLNVVAKKDGKELWRTDYAPSNYSVPVDLFGFKGMLWGPDIAMNLWRPMDDDLGYHAFDPLTGKAATSAKGKYNFRFQHHRCHQMRVVDNTILGGRAGIEFLDTESSKVAAHHWVRGSCYYGVMPANGLLYVPPHNCACYIRAKLSGFMALRTAAGTRTDKTAEDQRLQRGPAYGQTQARASATIAGDWPTYRHDAGRSGRVDTAIKTDLLLGWRLELGEKLASPVIAGNRVYVVSSETHRLRAFAALTGRELWQYEFDARVDSPPTVYQDLVLTGCRDGSVHAVRATDGKLVWRFLAAPQERMIVSRGQLESVWPVHGSVLVLKDTVYFTAGKSSYLDGGIRLYGLEPHTGRKIVDTVLSTLTADGVELLDEQGVKGYLSDILSSDGERLFMRHNILDLAGKPQPGPVTHLHGPDGFLSSDTASRIIWTYAPAYTSPHQGAFYDLRLSRALFPSGKLLVEGEDTIYGFGQNRPGENKAQSGGSWGLFSCPKKNDVPLNLTAREYLKLGKSGKHSLKFNWTERLPIHVLAMVKTKDVLFVAGPQGGGTISTAAAKGKTGAALFAVSPADGEVLAEMSLPAAPAWDGMAVANGNLYLTLLNGDVICLWSAASGRPGKKLDRTAWMPKLPDLKLAVEPGLIGRWRLDEGVGPVARDCSGKGHFAEVGGQWATGEFGTCVSAKGPRAVVIPDSKHLQFGMDSFSLALWVRIERHGIRILGKEAFPQNWWTINVFPTGGAELVLGEGRGAGLNARAKTKAPLATDAWTHLVFTVDRKAKLVNWYLNGKLDNTCPIPATMTKGLHADGADLAIPSSHKPFRGLIGDLRIYRKALDGKKVQVLHQEAATRYTSIEFKIKE